MHRRFTRSFARKVAFPPPRLSMAGIAALVATLGCASGISAQLPAPQVVGTGPARVGGYAGVTASLLERPESVQGLEVSELSAALLAWGQISPRTSYLVELDMAKRTSETWTGREADQWMAPERMYLEYTASELVRLRVGRFLTPVGQWNEQHAEPLTWTPTRPLATYLPFAKSLTGVLVAGDGSVAGRDVGYAAYWAPAVDFDGDLDDAQESSFISALGVRVAAVVRPGLTLGLSAGRVRRSRPEEDSTLVALGLVGVEREEDLGGRALLGADLRWARPSWELSVEANGVAAYETSPYEGGVFGMGSVRMYGPLWAVARFEAYRTPDEKTEGIGFGGFTLRADRRFVAKFGRQFTRHPSIRIPDGWFLSFSSLF